jgi:hypothetical protein
MEGGTKTNAGRIAGTNGTAVSFLGTGDNLLVVDPGAVFSGAVIGSTSASNILELASGGSTGTLSGLGTSFTNFGSVTVHTGALWGHLTYVQPVLAARRQCMVARSSTAALQ